MKEENKNKAILLAQLRNELTESIIYSRLSELEKNEKNRKILKAISVDEAAHARVISHILGDVKGTPATFKAKWTVFLARLFGLTFVLKLMERGEDNASKTYHQILDAYPKLAKIAEDEDRHENELIEMLDDERLNNIGSIVLGLNDALVELTGALAGFTFAMQDTKVIALAGLIIGISATFSMAASEFLSARQEGRTDAFKSCLYTGTAYLATVALLIMPYLVLSSHLYIIAMIWMLAMVVIEIAIFTYYISVAKDEKFKPKFIEMSAISIGVAVLSFLVSIAAKTFLGVDI
jgi:VIT1/CCC1 family predicted Fe2+/Mn2+ transporter